jgi:hypothetical protein
MSVLSYTQHLIAQQVKSGEIAIDATVGNGVDTCFLAKTIGSDGYLYGFDIQATAIESARARMLAEGHRCHTDWICDGHQHMSRYVSPEHKGKVAAVMFNLGFLPGGEDAHEGVERLAPVGRFGDESGGVVGFISRSDIVRAVAHDPPLDLWS